MNFTNINFDYVSQTLSNIFTQAPLVEGRSLDCLCEQAVPLAGAAALLIVALSVFDKAFETTMFSPNRRPTGTNKWTYLTAACSVLGLTLLAHAKMIEEQCHFRP